VIKAADAFKDKTTAPNQLWQTDFTHLKVIGSGWFYLSTVLDDFSRYIVAWKLCTTMKPKDVTATLDLAVQASGLDQARPADRPRLLSDNGSSYIAGDLAKWLDARNIKHLRGAPDHPMTQGKIERRSEAGLQSEVVEEGCSAKRLLFTRHQRVRISFLRRGVGLRRLANGSADPMHPDRHRLRCRAAARRCVG
jgi:transposase InsO family protein